MSPTHGIYLIQVRNKATGIFLYDNIGPYPSNLPDVGRSSMAPLNDASYHWNFISNGSVFHIMNQKSSKYLHTGKKTAFTMRNEYYDLQLSSLTTSSFDSDFVWFVDETERTIKTASNSESPNYLVDTSVALYAVPPAYLGYWDRENLQWALIEAPSPPGSAPNPLNPTTNPSLGLGNQTGEGQPSTQGGGAPECDPADNAPGPGIPPSLAGLDMTSIVQTSIPQPFRGLFFDIYRGASALKLRSTGVKFELVVAIKVLRPGFDNRSTQQQRDYFATVCYQKKKNSTIATPSQYILRCQHGLRPISSDHYPLDDERSCH